MARPKKYRDELVQRGVRLALESGRPIAEVARDLGMHPETLRKRVRQAQADSGARPDLPTTNEVSRYIDTHRGGFGVEPICRTLDVSASAYYQRATR